MLRTCVIGFCLLFALGFAVSGLRLINNVDKYFRPPGQPEYGDSYGEVSLRSGEQFTLRGSQANGNYFYCLSWQTQYGSHSVEVTGFARQYNENQLQLVTPGDICVRGGDYSITFKSKREQVVRWAFVIQHQWVRNPGTTSPVCARCDDRLPSFYEISTEKAVLSRGNTRLAFAGIFSAAALVAFVGTGTVLGWLYNIARALFPTKRSRLVREEFQRSKDGSTFDTQTTREYDKPPENDFRQQQDIDDLNEMTNKMRWEAERLQREEQELRRRKDEELMRQQEAVDDYEAAVRRVKELQEKMKNENQ